ncbi:MAG: IS3 family transposase [Candidatus Hydrogenedentes bacterium]|nr:IS3 family transposase [Candidatus Hydrogenedentota bacterium]
MKQQTEFRIQPMCRALQVSRSGYYDYLRRPPSAHNIEDDKLRHQVKAAFKKGRKNYGTRRIKVELKKAETTVSRRRIGRLMKEEALEVQTKRKFKMTTDSNHDKPIAPNLLEREFTVATPDTVYVGDITYIPTREGWLYLAVVIDLFSRAVVGWAMGARMKADLVNDAMLMAIWTRTPAEGLIFHSDRGSQYASDSYREILKAHGAQASMSKKGDCWDNAVAESFFHTLKIELVHHCDFETREEARAAIFEYIEVFYNRQRLHSSNGYEAPLVFEMLQEAA